jgi:hypothetical protein
MDRSLGSRSTATLIKLPTDAPIAIAKKISMRLSFPKDQADVGYEVLNREVLRLVKGRNEFSHVTVKV